MSKVTPVVARGGSWSRRRVLGRLFAGTIAASVYRGAAGAGGTGIEELSPLTPGDFGARGSGDEAEHLQSAIDMAAASGRPLQIDRDYTFARKLIIDRPVTLIGNRHNRLVWRGTGDAIEATAAVSIDGIVVDGGRDSAANFTQSNSAASSTPVGVLFGLHGEMRRSGPPTYLRNARIRWLRCENYDGRAGFAGFNLADGSIDHLEVENIGGNGIHLAGLANMTIGVLVTRKTGNLDGDGQRLGSGLAFFRETDSRKRPAEWVHPDGYLPTRGVTIELVDVAGATDSAVYLHDYLDGPEPAMAFSDWTVGSIVVDLAGKDGVKCREGVRDGHIGRIAASRIANRALTVTEFSHRITVDRLEARGTGFDAVGAMTGRAAPYNGTGTIGDGIGRSLQTNPMGFEVNDCDAVNVLTAKLRDAAPRPTDESGGHGVRMVNCAGFSGKWDVRDCFGNILRLSHVQDFDIVCIGQNAGVGARRAAAADVYVINDGFGDSVNGSIDYTGLVPGQAANSAYPVRINDGSGNIRLRISADARSWRSGTGQVLRNASTGAIRFNAKALPRSAL